ncbi:MAG: hypothetical protein QOI53_4556, partial [Verrucomicrobiota bacterium]|nr:hypothetical protein [Verrucomicrobiota bacterium]
MLTMSKRQRVEWIKLGVAFLSRPAHRRRLETDALTLWNILLFIGS